MAKTKRVFEIAKELGVDSKAIVEKCSAEGVPHITNHMSPVKLGLEMTIREWFGEAHQQQSAIEQAAPVDLVHARKASRRRAVHKDDSAVESPDATATETAEPVAHEPPAPVDAPASPAIEPPPAPAHEAPSEPAVAAPSEPVIVVASEPELSAPVAAPAPAISPAPAAPLAPAASATPPQAHPRVMPVGRPNVPDRPTVVSPAGRQLEKPKQAVLRGPQVVRIEKPDVMQPRRPRRPGGPGGPGGAGPAASEPGAVPGISRSRGPVRGRGAGAAPVEEEADSKAAAAKRRPLTTRRGRFAEALPTGPTKFSEQDLIELDARLNRATGYLKQRRRDLKKHEGGGQAFSAAVTGGRVEVAEPVTIKALSSATGIKTTDIIKYLFSKGIMATINSAIDSSMAQEVGLEYNIELVVREVQTAEEQVVAAFEQREAIDVRLRPPVVTVMGHVDHGKTSLLDRIRKADVAAHEAGGITQHVGAYRVTIKGTDGQDKTVVFLDTPGHEAFTSMRSRGASITDMVVLVVAADDGVMPQTLESINHAKAAGVPIIVALNKIDKAEATEGNIRKIFGQLAEHGLNPTEWGGDTEVLRVSAVQGVGVTELMEVLDYQSELLELKADYGGPARGTVIESQMQPGRGPVARVLLQQGLMKVGDFIVIGRAFGRVRDMSDDRGKPLLQAGPATPLEISGIDMIPDAGDKFYVTGSLKQAEEIAVQYREHERQKQLASQTKVTLENFADQLAAAGGAKELRVVLKADVQGSIDVLRKSLTDLSTSEVTVRVLHAAVGGVTESDVLLADASDAVIIGFHVVAPSIVRDLAEQRNIEIRLYRIIYEITEEVKKGLEGLLEPETREDTVGSADVREVFKISKLGSVAGCLVTEGIISRNAKVRLVRDGVVVTDNRSVESLRRVKDDVKEVRAGTECGLRLVGFEDIKPGDKVVCYNTVTVKRKLQ